MHVGRKGFPRAALAKVANTSCVRFVFGRSAYVTNVNVAMPMRNLQAGDLELGTRRVV